MKERNIESFKFPPIIKNIVLYSIITFSLVFAFCGFNAKAHDVNDTTVTEQSITWYIDFNSGSLGQYKGMFVESFNAPNGAVVYWDDYYSYIYYARLKDDGTVTWGLIEHTSTNKYGKSWLSSYSSSTYKGNGDSTGHSWDHYSSYVRGFGEMTSCTLPVFKNYAAASEYLLNGVMNSDTCLNYEDFTYVPSPEFIDLYNDSKNQYKFFISLGQDIDSLDNYKLDYSARIDINTSNVTTSEMITTQQLAISNPQKITLDLTDYLKDLIYTEDYHFANIEIKVKNVSEKGLSSDECTVIIAINSNGMAYTTTGFPNLTYPQNYTPIYNADGVVNDMYQGILGSNHINNYGDNDSSFIGSVVNGFGLLGNNGLFALMSQIFTFIPEPIWTMLFAFFGGAIAIALFKLVTR